MIELGSKVRDKISGLTGIAVCRSEWLYARTQITVQPQETKDGKPVETSYFDEAQLEVIESEAVIGFRASKACAPGGRA